MKKPTKLLAIVIFLFATSSLIAQDHNHKWQITLGANAVNFYPTNYFQGAFPNGSWFENFTELDHWNYVEIPSSLTVSKYWKKGFSLGVRGTYNEITNYGDNIVNELKYYGADGFFKYNLNNLWGGDRFNPFIEIGGGYTWVDDIGAGTANGGFGINYWITDKFGINVQSVYKHVFKDEYSTPVRPNIQPHFQSQVGLTYRFGKGTGGNKDREDKEKKGKKKKDKKKKNIKDDIQLAIVDTDGDGIEDDEDGCPDIPGTEATRGCPDADGDGVSDILDNCLDVRGPEDNNGCPWPDGDGDNVPDKDDKCPDVIGVVSNNGCPAVGRARFKEINEGLQDLSILFDTGKYGLKQPTVNALNNVLQIMKANPTVKFIIEGHTDSVGAAAMNQSLSENRASSVKDWLVENGISAERLSTEGYGESKPVAGNDSYGGRKQNRRVGIIINR